MLKYPVRTRFARFAFGEKITIGGKKIRVDLMIAALFQSMSNDIPEIDYRLNGNYSFMRIHNFLACERQILKRMDQLL